MRIFFSICMFLCIGMTFFSIANAGFFDDFISDGAPELRYCQGGECGLDQGIEHVKEGISDIETDRSASQYIQDIARYLLMFISIVAVLYIMYAGFQILIGNGDEEKLKKSRQTIVYVAIGIVLIWLAWPITRFILLLLNA